MANSVFYYSILDTEEINGEDAIPGFTSPRVELDREQDSIREAPLLPCTAPQIGSRSLFFKYKSKSQVSDETDIHYMTIHDRKVKILRTLKNFWINKIFPYKPPYETGLIVRGFFYLPFCDFENFISDDLNTLTEGPQKEKATSEDAPRPPVE